jgi:hypothetical protein
MISPSSKPSFSASMRSRVLRKSSCSGALRRSAMTFLMISIARLLSCRALSRCSSEIVGFQVSVKVVMTCLISGQYFYGMPTIRVMEMNGMWKAISSR